MGVCRIPRPQDPAAAAQAEVIELLFTYVDRLQSHFESIAAAHDLSSIQAKVILSLGQPEPMGCLAQELGCDPSNVTSLVDRLEQRGLLTRAGSLDDRRVKVLEATSAGTRLREALSSALFGDVPGMGSLSTIQVSELRQALRALCGLCGSAPGSAAVEVSTHGSTPVRHPA
jgi:DNA-binding MarR family transcriptional regulator